MSAWVDITIMSLTFFLSIIYNVEVGVVVSLIISLLLVVHRSSKTRMTILVRYYLFYCDLMHAKHVCMLIRAAFLVLIVGNL